MRGYAAIGFVGCAKRYRSSPGLAWQAHSQAARAAHLREEGEFAGCVPSTTMNTMCGAVEGPASLRSHSTAAATAASVALAMQMRILSTPRGRSNRALLAPLLTPGSRRCLAVLAWFRARFFPSCQAATEHGAPRLSLHARPFRAPGGGGCANWCVANRVWNVERLVVNKENPIRCWGRTASAGCLLPRRAGPRFGPARGWVAS